MSSEWFISGNPTKYDVVSAFKELNKINWKQSTNIEIGDIVYLYVSQGYQAVKFKCKVNKVDLPKPEIDDKKFDVTGEFDGTYGRYMELELLEELKGDLYSKNVMKSHGFQSPQSPVRVIPQMKEYLELLQFLQDSNELDPDHHDGSYELVRETINSYSKMNDLSQIDYKDLNLVYLMSIGTWKQKVPAKKNTISDSHLPNIEKQHLSDVLDKVWAKAERGEYENQESGKASIGMFGTGFFTFQGKTDDESPRNFIQMCIDIKDMQDDEEIFNRCEKTLNDKFHGMKAASASMILHCLKPKTFPIFNSNMGADNIYVYLGIDIKCKTEINTYIKNARIVKKFRDDNFTIKNYRIFDMAAWNIGKNKNHTNIDLKYNIDEDGKVNNLEFDKNIILYGPPGTGKTYNTAIYAVAICDGKSLEEVKKTPYKDVLKRYNELKVNEKRVAFTTFHQSYGYEEFIEGIKPKMNSDSDDVAYTIKPGVFKEFCDRASKKKTVGDEKVVVDNAVVWNVILGGKDHPELKQICFDEGTIRIGWHTWPETITEDTENLNDKGKRILLNFQDEMQIGDIVIARSSTSAVDGIGIVTGDAEFDTTIEEFPRKRTVNWLCHGEDIDIIDLNGGTRLDRKSVYPLYRINAADILSRIPSNAGVEIEEETRPYVFIIDEINRGNISKIFGELITLIEPTKRKGAAESMEAVLPYSNTPFGVPKNVYIIGTMNTADRSIALMDTALRRRFQFEEMMPDSNALKEIGANQIVDADGTELDVAAMLDKINQRIEYLFDREHTIGHAFFTGLKDEPTVEKLASIFKKSIIPLLQEYFYEDYSKIMLVLGDNGKTNPDHRFVLATETKANSIFRGDASDIDIPDFSYKIQEKAFYDINSYKEIIG